MALARRCVPSKPVCSGCCSDSLNGTIPGPGGKPMRSPNVRAIGQLAVTPLGCGSATWCLCCTLPTHHCWDLPHTCTPSTRYDRVLALAMVWHMHAQHRRHSVQGTAPERVHTAHLKYGDAGMSTSRKLSLLLKLRTRGKSFPLGRLPFLGFHLSILTCRKH